MMKRENMKLTFDRNDLFATIKSLKSIPGRTDGNIAQSGVYIEVDSSVERKGEALVSFHVVSPTFNFYVTSRLHCEFVSGEIKPICAPLDRLYSLLSESKAHEIKFTYNPDKRSLRIKAKKWATIKTYDPSLFPRLDIPVVGEPTCVMTPGVMHDIAAKVIHASAGKSEVKFALYGVNLSFDNDGYVTAACLDGKRFAGTFDRPLLKKNYDTPFSVTLMATDYNLATSLFSENDNINCFYVDGKFVFSTDQTVAYLNCIDGVFPDYKKLIPESAGIQEGFYAVVNTFDILEALGWVSTINRELVELDIVPASAALDDTGGSGILVSSYGQEVGEAVVEVSAFVQGYETGVRLYVPYVIQQVKLMQSLGYEKIGLFSDGRERPLLFKPEVFDDIGEINGTIEYIALIMPIAGKTRYQMSRQ